MFKGEHRKGFYYRMILRCILCCKLLHLFCVHWSLQLLIKGLVKVYVWNFGIYICYCNSRILHLNIWTSKYSDSVLLFEIKNCKFVSWDVLCRILQTGSLQIVLFIWLRPVHYFNINRFYNVIQVPAFILCDIFSYWRLIGTSLYKEVYQARWVCFPP